LLVQSEVLDGWIQACLIYRWFLPGKSSISIHFLGKTPRASELRGIRSSPRTFEGVCHGEDGLSQVPEPKQFSLSKARINTISLCHWMIAKIG
jgi:hypothetical protein